MWPALLLILFLLHPLPVAAETAVTATVPAPSPSPSTQPPDTPVLISPDNHSTISTTVPTFIFNPSEGSTVVSYYQLWLDGTKDTDHIIRSPITITTNASKALSEGLHTWKIKAIGSNDTTRDSATWTFTIDTTPPLILIESIANQTTSLSSLNLDSFTPGLNFTTSERYPAFSGQGETQANLTISLTSFNTSTTINTIVDTSNRFYAQPGIALPLDTYTVSVSSIDASGNTTALPSFTLTISAAAAPTITLPLPSPLPDLQFKLPFSPSLLQLTPSLPQELTAYPLQTAPVSYWPWLIILLLIIHTLSLRSNHRFTKILSFITLLLAILLLLYLSLSTHHLIPLSLFIIGLILLFSEIFYFTIKP